MPCLVPWNGIQALELLLVFGPALDERRDSQWVTLGEL